MKVGDLVQLNAEAMMMGFHDYLLDAIMLVTAVETTFPGSPEIDMAPVVQVICPDGLTRFNIGDLEVIHESR